MSKYANGPHPDGFTFRAETLEPRRLLAAAVTGNVFNDGNANGTREAGEAGVAGVTVTLSPLPAANGSPAGTTTLSTATNSVGHYAFEGVVAGRYRVSETIPAGKTQTRPAPAASYEIVLVDGGRVVDQNFGLRTTPPTPAPTGRIAGVVFNDANGNGVRESGEAGLANVTITLSFNHDKRTTLTNASGEYVFAGLSANTYTLGETVLSGYVQTKPKASATYTITLAAGQVVKGEPFGQFKVPPPAAFGSISGTLFTDANANGIFDPGETVSGERTVYLDANRNGYYDAGEIRVRSKADGSYRFGDLAPGTYYVSRVFPAGFKLSNNSNGYLTVTVAAGQAVTGINIGTRQT